MDHNAGEIVDGPSASVPLFRDKGTDTKGPSPVIFPPLYSFLQDVIISGLSVVIDRPDLAGSRGNQFDFLQGILLKGDDPGSGFLFPAFSFRLADWDIPSQYQRQQDADSENQKKKKKTGQRFHGI